MAPLKILISGGGVAGTSLAFWLAKLKHSVTVVEQYPCLRTTGLQIDLRGHGIEVLKRMGLEEDFRKNAAPEEGMQLIDAAGRKRAYFGANKTGKGAQGITSDYEIMRGDLCRIIHDATEESAKYVYGTSIASSKEVENAIEVTFKDGRTDTYDLVVGCDGVMSTTRKMMLNSEDVTVGYESLHEYNAYLTFKKSMEANERYVGQLYFAPERRSILLRRHNPHEMQLYFTYPQDDERLLSVRRGDVDAEKKAFAEIYKGAGWRVPELIEEMLQSKDFYCERLGLVRLESWHKGRIALLGDAAYSPGGSGLGTTCAMVGAYVLAGEIARCCGSGDGRIPPAADNSVAAALKAYEDRFRPYMDGVQKSLSSPPSFLHPNTALGVATLHYIASGAATLMSWFAPLTSLFTFTAEAQNWDLPGYAEMRGIA